MSKETFESKVDAYLKTTTWLGESDPVAFGLREAAKELDAKWTTSLWAEFNKTIRYIESTKPVSEGKPKTNPLLAPVTGLETR